ncbi:MAG: hypothetical protein AVDCRST_MAG11-3028, partial [uncultured Gemmatimonadaceae bacterium]
ERAPAARRRRGRRAARPARAADAARAGARRAGARRRRGRLGVGGRAHRARHGRGRGVPRHPARGRDGDGPAAPAGRGRGRRVRHRARRVLPPRLRGERPRLPAQAGGARAARRDGGPARGRAAAGAHPRGARLRRPPVPAHRPGARLRPGARHRRRRGGGRRVHAAPGPAPGAHAVGEIAPGVGAAPPRPSLRAHPPLDHREPRVRRAAGAMVARQPARVPARPAGAADHEPAVRGAAQGPVRM